MFAHKTYKILPVLTFAILLTPTSYAAEAESKQEKYEQNLARFDAEEAQRIATWRQECKRERNSRKSGKVRVETKLPPNLEQEYAILERMAFLKTLRDKQND